MSAPTLASPTTPAEVARARVAIMVATYQVDVVLPTKFSIETYINDLLAVLAEAIDDDTVDFRAESGHWTLARPGHTPIPSWSTLADQNIADGALLVLSTTESAEAFSPLVEDITDALARINEREFAEFDSDTAELAGVCAFGVGSIVVAVLLSWSWTKTGSLLWCALPALILGIACAVAAMAVRRRDTPGSLGLGLTASALPLLFAGAAMVVPTQYGHPGPFTAANLAAGSAVVAVFAALRLRSATTGTAFLLETAVLGLLIGLAASVITYFDISVHQTTAGAVLAGLLLLTAAPRLAVLVARIRPSDLPDPGREVSASTLTDIFDSESAPSDEMDMAAELFADPRQDRAAGTIESRARLAVTGLRGLIVAASAMLAGATVLSVASSPGGIREIVMAIAVAGILVMRARWYPDRVQAIALIAAAGVTAIGVGFVTVGAYASAPARLVVALVITAAAIAGCAAGIRLPTVRLSPVVRRIIDLIEYLFILIVPVSACWIMGIYTAMRAI